MSGWDDLYAVTPHISSDDAERLLSGASGLDMPDELADLNAVLGALRGPAEPAELAGLQSALAAFGTAVVTTYSDPSTARTRPMLRKLLTGKAIATIGVVTLVSAGAAASGVVPTPFSSSKPSASASTEVDDDNEQSGDTVAVDTLTVTTPTTDEAVEAAALAAADADAEADDATDGTDGQGPDVNGPAKFGLCTAYEARTKHDTTTTTEAAPVVAEPVSEDADGDLPVPFQALSDAAEAAGMTVAEFCADAVPGGSDDAPGKSGDNPSATAPGQSDDNPSATAPGQSDDNPSATAPGKSENPGGDRGKPENPGGDRGKPENTQP